jgi:amidase
MAVTGSASERRGSADFAGKAAAPVRSAAAPEIVMMNAIELAQAIQSRQVSCAEVMDAYLDHIGRINPHVNAIVSLQDAEDLMKQASERDDALAQGRSMGLMHGFPQAIKDLAATKGIRTTQGSPILADFVPREDAIYVERIRRAGGIIIGKTNTPEFGLGSQTYNPVFGTTRNAYDPSKTSGGSSGGAAVALALRMLPVADGSDHGGSLRNPAAFNNVLGFRTSYGRIPAALPDAFNSSLSVAGPMARTVPDLAMLLSVLAGYDPRAPLSNRQDPAQIVEPLRRDFRGARVAWAGDFGGYLRFEPGVLDLCKRAARALEALGCIVEEAWPDYPIDRVWENWQTLRAWQVGCKLKEFHADPAKRVLMKPEAQWEVESGLRLSAFQVFDASVARTSWYQAVRKFFERYDYLVLPSAQVFPFDARTHWPSEIAGRKMDTYHRWMEVMIPITMSGCPALAVPAGFNDAGLPSGLQLVAPNHGELACLQLAYAYDAATGWIGRRKPALLTSS